MKLLVRGGARQEPPQQLETMSYIHRDALTFVRKHFLEDGTPTALHKKCLNHFKDRFRYAIRELVTFNGGRATKNVTYTLKRSPAGAELEARVRVEGSDLTHSNITFAYESAQRLASPVMREAGFQVAYITSQNQPILSGDWEKLMMRNGEGLIAAEAWAEEALSAENRADGLEDVVVRAVMVFHHPDDRLVQEALTAEASGWPSGMPSQKTTWKFSDGELVWAPPYRFLLWDRTSLRWDREMQQGKLGHQYHNLEIDNSYDGRGAALAEAASSPRACFRDLKTLADRLQMSTNSTGVDSMGLAEDYLRPLLLEPLKAWVPPLLEAGGQYLAGEPPDQPVTDTTNPDSKLCEVVGEVKGAFGELSLRLLWARVWEPELVLEVILTGARGRKTSGEELERHGGARLRRWRPPSRGPEGQPLNLQDPGDLSRIREGILAEMLHACRELKEEIWGPANPDAE